MWYRFSTRRNWTSKDFSLEGKKKAKIIRLYEITNNTEKVYRAF